MGCRATRWVDRSAALDIPDVFTGHRCNPTWQRPIPGASAGSYPESQSCHPLKHPSAEDFAFNCQTPPRAIVDVIEYLRAENRVLREKLGKKRILRDRYGGHSGKGSSTGDQGRPRYRSSQSRTSRITVARTSGTRMAWPTGRMTCRLSVEGVPSSAIIGFWADSTG